MQNKFHALKSCYIVYIVYHLENWVMLNNPSPPPFPSPSLSSILSLFVAVILSLSLSAPPSLHPPSVSCISLYCLYLSFSLSSFLCLTLSFALLLSCSLPSCLSLLLSFHHCISLTLPPSLSFPLTLALVLCFPCPLHKWTSVKTATNSSHWWKTSDKWQKCDCLHTHTIIPLNSSICGAALLLFT